MAVAEAELQRSSTLGLSDPKSLSEVELLKLKLKKEQIALKLAETQASKLDVEAQNKVLWWLIIQKSGKEGLYILVSECLL